MNRILSLLVVGVLTISFLAGRRLRVGPKSSLLRAGRLGYSPRNPHPWDPEKRRASLRHLRLYVLFLLVIAAVCVTYPAALTATDEPNLSKEQIKQFLLTAKVVGSHQSKKGVTNTSRLTLSDGTLTHDASFQPVDEHERVKHLADGRTEMNFVDSYKYNIAAYALAELVAFDDMMPVYVERKVEGHPGSLSWWLPVKMDDADRVEKKIEPPDIEKWNRQMARIRVFDAVSYTHLTLPTN